MIAKLERSAADRFGLAVDGRVSVEQFDVFVPEMEDLIRQYGKIKILFVIKSMAGYGFKEFAADIKFAVRHWSDVSKVALVSDMKWMEIGTKIDNLFTRWEERYFPLDELEAAWTWIES